MEDYLIEFATLLKEGNAYRFQLDNGRQLIPINPEKASGDTGLRVLLNYVPLQADSIKINYAEPIFTSLIDTGGYPDNYRDDPVKVQSVWVGGDYLNLIVEIDYHSTSHTMSLLQDREADGIDLYISHSRNNDLPGSPHVMYASFLLTSLNGEGDQNGLIPFRLLINTYQGQREYFLQYRPTR